jgi:hypothetical protein
MNHRKLKVWMVMPNFFFPDLKDSKSSKMVFAFFITSFLFVKCIFRKEQGFVLISGVLPARLSRFWRYPRRQQNRLET